MKERSDIKFNLAAKIGHAKNGSEENHDNVIKFTMSADSLKREKAILLQFMESTDALKFKIDNFVNGLTSNLNITIEILDYELCEKIPKEPGIVQQEFKKIFRNVKYENDKYLYFINRNISQNDNVRENYILSNLLSMGIIRCEDEKILAVDPKNNAEGEGKILIFDDYNAAYNYACLFKNLSKLSQKKKEENFKLLNQLGFTYFDDVENEYKFLSPQEIIDNIHTLDDKNLKKILNAWPDQGNAIEDFLESECIINIKSELENELNIRNQEMHALIYENLSKPNIAAFLGNPNDKEVSSVIITFNRLIDEGKITLSRRTRELYDTVIDKSSELYIDLKECKKEDILAPFNKLIDEAIKKDRDNDVEAIYGAEGKEKLRLQFNSKGTQASGFLTVKEEIDQHCQDNSKAVKEKLWQDFIGAHAKDPNKSWKDFVNDQSQPRGRTYSC